MNLLNKISNFAKGNAGTINTLSGLYGVANIISKLTGGKTIGQGTGYRPSTWQNKGKSSEVLMKTKTNIGGLFFDAILTESTEESLTTTKHPTQLGAEISDHAFINPTKISISAAISDAMACMSKDGYPGGNTKSINAWDWLVTLQRTRIPLKVRTHLASYDNMLITSVTAEHDSTTRTGLRVNIQLEQCLIVSVGNEKVSARAWTSAGENNASTAPEPEERGSIIAEATGTGETNLRGKAGL